MFRWSVLVVAGLTLSGCALEDPQVDTARLYGPAFGSNADPDQAAINISSWAFSSASNTANRPIEAARAVAAVDYLAGELNTGFRWAQMSPIPKMEMLNARAQVRTAIGIAPNARSQSVVDRLLTAADALQHQDAAAAEAALAAPTFTLPPQETLARLDRLPFMSQTNVATQTALRASGQLDGCSGCN